MARPTKLTKEVEEKILHYRREGWSLNRICSDEETAAWAPARSTVSKWIAENQEFSDKYDVATRIGTEIEFDEMKDIAWSATPETVQCTKLILDTLKWTTARKLPKKYGDRQAIEVDAKVEHTVQTREELEQKLRTMGINPADIIAS